MSQPTYTCPTCGEKMERDLQLFIGHTDKHIVDELKKKHPAWITEDGFCQKCLDHYKMSISDPEAAAAMVNLDARGVRRRMLLGVAGFCAAILMLFWLRDSAAPRWIRLALFPMFFFGELGLLQARQKTCVLIAQKQAPAMRAKARRILFFAVLIAALMTAASFMLR